MCLQAIYGRVVETLNCSGYDHNWVRNYQYEENREPLIPKGTILHAIGWFVIQCKPARAHDAAGLANLFGDQVRARPTVRLIRIKWPPFFPIAQISGRFDLNRGQFENVRTQRS